MESVLSLENVSKGKRIQSSIAMTLTLISFAMLFASLFLGYCIFRFNSPIWPPMGMEKVDLFIPAISTVFVLLGSATYMKFQKQRFLKKDFTIWFWPTVILGACFLISQVTLWTDLKAQGIYVADGIFQSLLFSYTWIHAAHMVAAWLMLFLLLPILKKETLSEGDILKVVNIGKFWHFLGIVWVAMFISLFVF